MNHLRFNATEILDIAIRIERNGAAFYRKAAEARQSNEDRSFLLDLAAMEEDHERIFAGIRENLPNKPDNTFAPPDEESGLYLEAMADYHGGEGNLPAADQLTGNETLVEIIRIAIDLEQKSILYYDGLRPMVPPDLGRDRVDQVIAEERRHVAVLQRELRRLMSA